jgi:arginine exporter protein ArgO
VGAALQGAMTVVFWAGAVVAASAFLIILGFPHVEIAPPRSSSAATEAPPAE